MIMMNGEVKRVYIMRICRIIDPGYKGIKMVMVKEASYRESLLQSNSSGEKII